MGHAGGETELHTAPGWRKDLQSGWLWQKGVRMEPQKNELMRRMEGDGRETWVTGDGN